MKKLKFLFGIILAFCLLLPVGCGKSALAAPESLYIDSDELVLYWSADPDVRSYTVEIASDGNRTTESTYRSYFSLSDLAEGDYEIRVRAVGGNNGDTVSPWSETVEFHREHELGILYSLINNNTAYEIRGVGTASGALEIDGTYRGKPVTRIANTAFRASKKIESVVIPQGVTYIGSSAFYNCTNLVSVQLPDSVEYIGDSAFQHCGSLTQINIPASLKTISPYMFAYCRALESIDLGENVEAIEKSAFNSCSSLRALDVPDSVTRIDAYAFAENDELEEVTFGANLETIGNYAFSGNSALCQLSFRDLNVEMTFGTGVFMQCSALKEVVLPEGLTSIGVASFSQDEALESVHIPSSVTEVCRSAFNETALYRNQTVENGDNDGLIYADHWLVDATQELKSTVTRLGEVNSNGPYAFFREDTVGIADQAFLYRIVHENEDGTSTSETVACENLTRITFPSTLKYIGEYAFFNANQLTRVWATAENSLVSVGYGAFSYCERLDNVQFANGLKTIEKHAFLGCSSLDNNPNNPDALVPATVTRIGEYAFYGTALWESYQITDSVVYAGRWVVGYRSGEMYQSIVELRDNTVGIADYAFYDCTELQNLIGLNKASVIGKGAFAGCTNLSAASLNINLTEIRDFTFYNCESIFSVTLPTMLRSVGQYSFYNCNGFVELNFLDTNVTEIGDGAFRGCSRVKKITFGGNLERIGDYAFYGCTTLPAIELPDSVVTVGERAFGSCSGLETLDLGAGLTEIGDYAFENCTALKVVEIPASVKRVGDYAFLGGSAIETLTLQEGVEEIGSYAFYGLKMLRNVTLPESVRTVGTFAFSGCTRLYSVLLRGQPTIIGDNAFYGCSHLTVYAATEGAFEGWSGSWNSSYRPVVRGCTLSDDGGYVVSVAVGEIVHAQNGLSAPYRAGFTFVGWSAERGAQTAEYSSDDLIDLPSGMVLFSVWKEGEPEYDELDEDAEASDDPDTVIEDPSAEPVEPLSKFGFIG